MSYVTVKSALMARLSTVSGLNSVLGYEPTAINPPMIYLLLESFTRGLSSGQLTAMEYRILCRLCIRWVDFEQAELELDPFVNGVPAAIDADPQLGGVLTQGLASVGDAKAVFVSIGGVVYRALDVTVSVLEKAPYASGI